MTVFFVSIILFLFLLSHIYFTEVHGLEVGGRRVRGPCRPQECASGFLHYGGRTAGAARPGRPASQPLPRRPLLSGAFGCQGAVWFVWCTFVLRGKGRQQCTNSFSAVFTPMLPCVMRSLPQLQDVFCPDACGCYKSYVFFHGS